MTIQGESILRRMRSFFRSVVYPRGIVTGNILLSCRARWLGRIEEARNKRFLDIGVGGGYFSRALCEHGASGGDAIAYDAREEKDTTKFLRRHGLNDRVRVHTMHALRIVELGKSYDIVMCFEVIEHISKDKELIQNIAQCQPIGGMLYLSTPNRRNRDVIKEGYSGVEPEHVRLGYTHDDLKGLLEENGYQVVEVDYCGSGYVLSLNRVYRWILRLFGQIECWSIFARLVCVPFVQLARCDPLFRSEKDYCIFVKARRIAQSLRREDVAKGCLRA